MIRMKVKLLAYTPDPEKLVAAAAKNCYSSTDVDSVLDGLTEEKTESFVNMLSEIGHESPIEHVSFTFAIEGVSRSLLAQITRHRIASFSVQSQRYVREKGFEYVVPPEIDKIPAARAKFIQAMEDDQRTYEELTAVLMEGYLKELLEQGVPEKTALVLVNGTVLLNLIYQGQKLLLGHLGAGLQMKDLGQQLLPAHKQNVQRQENPDQELHDRCR